MANRSRGPRNNNWRGGPIAKSCKHCASEFVLPAWLAKKRRFCGLACSRAAARVPGARPTRPHVRAVERVLGRRLPPRAVVHHVDENRQNNAHSNLVLCEDQAYHLLLHARTRVLRAGGKPARDRICARCFEVKPIGAFHAAPGKALGVRPFCRECQAAYHQERKTHGRARA